MNIVLIGYRATGKTSVGRRLGARLGVPFHDTDEVVALRTGKSVRELVDRGGWRLFREEERSAVAAVSGLDGCVIALGGGAVLDEENVRRLGRKGLFVWLRADAGTIVRRMGEDRGSGDQRPPLSGSDRGEETPELLRSRERSYENIAHFAVETAERGIEEVCEAIVRWMRIEVRHLSFE